MIDNHIFWMKLFLWLCRNVEVLNTIYAGIHPYPNCYHCGNAFQHISQRCGSQKLNLGWILYPAMAAVVHNSLPCHTPAVSRTLTGQWSLVTWSNVAQYWMCTTSSHNYFVNHYKKLHAIQDIFPTYWRAKTTDSIAQSWMKDLKM